MVPEEWKQRTAVTLVVEPGKPVRRRGGVFTSLRGDGACRSRARRWLGLVCVWRREAEVVSSWAEVREGLGFVRVGICSRQWESTVMDVLVFSGEDSSSSRYNRSCPV